VHTTVLSPLISPDTSSNSQEPSLPSLDTNISSHITASPSNTLAEPLIPFVSPPVSPPTSGPSQQPLLPLSLPHSEQPPPSVTSRPMLTRAKTGSLKPKTFLTTNSFILPNIP
jgi:hypothetical protein